MQNLNGNMNEIYREILDFIMLVLLTENVIFHFSVVVLTQKLQKSEYIT